MQKICRNCKFWEPLSDTEKYGFCLHEKVAGAHAGYDTEPLDGVRCSDVFCGIETGPDFGCIHFEVS